MMNTFNPIQVTLKNNTVAIIRQAQTEDAERLLSCIRAYIPDSEYIPKLEHEMTWTVQDVEDWIHSFRNHPNSLLLVAEVNTEIVGNIDLTANKRKIMEHTAVIGMGLLKDYRNLGLGTLLLQHAIQWAKENPFLELLWLQVYTHNQAGLSLYRKLGFIENGIIKNFFKHDKAYFDNLTMTLPV